MKRYILMLAIMIGINTCIKAQQKTPTPDEMAKKSMEELDKRLKLNPTQKNVIYNYTLDFCKEQQVLLKKRQSGNSSEDDVSKFYKMEDETDKNIRNILKGDQQTEYDKIVEERRSGDSGKKKNKKGKHHKEEEETGTTGIAGLQLKP